MADSKKTVFKLAAESIDKDFAPIVKVNDAKVSNYTVDYDAGKITFSEAPYALATPGQDNVSVEFSVTVAGNREKILKCTLLQVFDNRVFFSGSVFPCLLPTPAAFTSSTPAAMPWIWQEQKIFACMAFKAGLRMLVMLSFKKKMVY